MLISSAINLVQQLVFFPGWKFTATDHTNRFEGSILVRIDYTAQETGRENARQGYPETINTYATFPMIVVDCDDTMLYRKIANAITKIQIHELREALRVHPTCWAPFHPHNVDGMKRWLSTDDICNDDALMGDMQFGIG